MVRVKGSRCAHAERDRVRQAHRDRHARRLRRPAASAALESLEGRRLLSVTTTSGSAISDMGDYCVKTEARFGDNGWVGGGNTIDGVAISDGVNDLSTTAVEWDGDLLDGLDSGTSDVLFGASTDGTDLAQWRVGEYDRISSYADLCQGISSIAIRAAVARGGMAFLWSDLVVSFKRDGELMQTVNVGDVSADTCAAINDDPAETIAVVTPSASDYDEVIVTGSIRMLGNVGITPDPYDIFGQVLVYDA